MVWSCTALTREIRKCVYKISSRTFRYNTSAYKQLRAQASGRPQLRQQPRAQGATLNQQSSHCNLRYSQNWQNPKKPGTTKPHTSQLSPHRTTVTAPHHTAPHNTHCTTLTTQHSPHNTHRTTLTAPHRTAPHLTSPHNSMAHHRCLSTLNPKPHL